VKPLEGYPGALQNCQRALRADVGADVGAASNLD